MLSETEGLHKGVQLLENYCDDCRLTVYIKKKNINVFQILQTKTKHFICLLRNLEIANQITYLGVIFTTGGSFNTYFL
jgi:hypothetical protein